MYRNVVYNNRSRDITLWAWDEDGERVERRYPFKPYIHFEQKKGKDGVSIFNTPLTKREFDTDFDRRKFVENSGIRRIFSNLPPEQQFLIDHFGDISDRNQFMSNPLRTFFIDIEVFSPDEFPHADDAKHPVNLITLYDTLTRKYQTWGMYPYSTTREDVVYHNCKTESGVLRSFMKYWTKNYPDMMSGWNCDGFDTPYLINRITRLFGDSYANQISPTNRIWSNEKLDRFKNPITEWHIQGLSCIDYMKAYKKFSINERESYTLDYISQYELGVGKVEHEGSLAELSIKDWTTFVDYNIRDVELIVDLERKLHFLELCRMLGYKGLTKFEKALGTNNIVAGAFALEARKMGYIIPTFQNENTGRAPGGLVHHPENGFNDDIISFDASSLYPNTIISLNLSPETKLGQAYSDDNFTFITTVRGKEFKLRNDEFKSWMVKNKVCKSVHGTLFAQNVKGIIPRIIEDIYAERKTSKNKGKRLERAVKKLEKSDPKRLKLAIESEELDVYQYTLKILMNSIYGTFGNQYSVLYDLDMSGSITLTGQEVNRQSCIAVEEYAKDRYDVSDRLVIYGDTDSIYLTLTPIFNKLGINLTKSEKRIEGKAMKITKDAMDIIEEIGGEEKPENGIITQHLSKWALAELNSLDPRFEFKREKISKRGIFLNAKKRYILQALDNEGVPIEVGSDKEFSVTGIEGIVSATHAKEVKAIMMEILKTMIISKDVDASNVAVQTAYAEFCKLTPEVLANRISIKNLKKYEKLANGFTIGKGTPQNSKGSILFNSLLDHLTLANKYEKIKSGDKIKIIYLAKNSYGLNYIAFKDKFPKEFNMEPNYKQLYGRQVHSIVERIFKAVSWQMIDPTKNYECDILSEFS